MLLEPYDTTLSKQIALNSEPIPIKFLRAISEGEVFNYDPKIDVVLFSKSDFFAEFKKWVIKIYANHPPNICNNAFWRNINNKEIDGHVFYSIPHSKTKNTPKGYKFIVPKKFFIPANEGE